jgi:hypothetical protein
MAIDLDKQCPDGKHDFHPIIEGNQTVGLVCLLCDKTVRENMEHSEIYVTGEKHIVGLELLKMPALHPGGPSPRKDPRF